MNKDKNIKVEDSTDNYYKREPIIRGKHESYYESEWEYGAFIHCTYDEIKDEGNLSNDN